MTHTSPPHDTPTLVPHGTDVFRRDSARLAAVEATGLLDTEVEEVFDRLTRLAVRLVGVPAAFISLVDENRDFYKSACGFGEPLATERELAGLTFCHHTIQRTEPLVIPDTAADPVYRDVPTVRTLGVAAYVGVPLVVNDHTIGAFCAIDVQPRPWTKDQIEVLVELAASAQREIVVRGAAAAAERAATELRLRHAELEQSNELLRDQATELELQAEELQVTTEELQERTELAETMSIALTDSESRYRTMAESVPVQVWTATPDGNLDFVNGSAVQFFNAPKESLLGTGWAAFVHPDDLPSASQRWATALAAGTPYETEFRLLNGATGRYHWHLARALPLRGPDGAVVGWSGSNTDVEAERSARAEAERANRSKSEFLTNMSHELRTPLNAIDGYAALIADGIAGDVSADQRNFIERIRRAQRHLLGLINGILNYAKVDAGSIEYAEEELSLNELIASCEALTMPQMQAKGLVFRCATPECDSRVLGDREKLQQILLNLLSNALKFTEPGGSICIECAHGDARRIHIAVIDTGPGIPETQLTRLFQPFVRLDTNLTRRTEGTGLGLAISRELARGMGGDILAASTVGVGSTFTLVVREASDTGVTTLA